jgi:TRAP-type C4-dicarboxylate transport system permease small subunit
VNNGDQGDRAAALSPEPSAPERLISLGTRFGAQIATAGVLLVLAVTGYSVFNRYILGTPVTWTDELSGYLVVAIVMFGAAETLRRGEHISVDLVTARAGPRLGKSLAVWGLTAVMLLMVAVLWSSVVAVRFSWDFEMYSDGYLAVQMWVPQSALVIGSLLVLLAAATRLFTILTNRKRAG